jgi:hypothetical protein
MGECTGKEMEVAEVPILNFPEIQRQITVIVRIMVPRFEIRTQLNSLSVNYFFS